MPEVSNLALIVGVSIYLILPALGLWLLQLDSIQERWTAGKSKIIERPIQGIDALFIGNVLLVLFGLSLLGKIFGGTVEEVDPSPALEAAIGSSSIDNNLFMLVMHGVILTLCFLTPSCLRTGPKNSYGLWQLDDGWSMFRRALAILFISLPFVFGSALLSTWVGEMFLPAGEKLSTQPAVENAKQATGALLTLLVTLVTVVTAPLWEEFTFRGVILPYFCRLQGVWLGLVTVGILFGAFHLHLPVVLPLSILGFALGAAYVYTGSITAPIFMHSTFNAANLIAAKSGLG